MGSARRVALDLPHLSRLCRSPGQPYRFGGGYTDAATGLIKLGVRYYDPTQGRFTQQDPTGQEANSYAYVWDDPTSFSDSTGASVWGDIGKAVLKAGISLLVAGVVEGLVSLALPPLGVFSVPIASAVGGCVGGALAGYLFAPSGQKVGSAIGGCVAGAIFKFASKLPKGKVSQDTIASGTARIVRAVKSAYNRKYGA